MISVEDAQNLVVGNSFLLPPVRRKISETLHCVVSQDILSPIPYPPFHQSAMDGFALKHSDFEKETPLSVVGESAAGFPFSETLKEGQTIRIFTGAMIPVGADSVVVQEKAAIENGMLIIQDPSLTLGSNIRYKGSQISNADVVLKKGQIINPGTIGLLASLGVTEVEVFPSPRVTLIVTGSELIRPGSPLQEGQVYESNSYSINAAFELSGVRSAAVIFTGDDKNKIKEQVKTAIDNSDLVLATGGISVGKYDFVGNVFHELGVKNIFYKIAQKPGKPLYFGKLGSCLVFGLPGNPASSLSCFYEYVFPALRVMQGHQSLFLIKQLLPITANTPKKEGLSLFLKGKIRGEKVEVLSGQESSNISSFSLANCLIYIPASKGNVSEGELVEVHILP